MIKYLWMIFILSILAYGSPTNASEVLYCKGEPQSNNSLSCVIKTEKNVRVFVGSEALVYSEGQEWMVAVGKVKSKKDGFIVAVFDRDKEPVLKKGRLVIFYNPADQTSSPLL